MRRFYFYMSEKGSGFKPLRFCDFMEIGFCLPKISVPGTTDRLPIYLHTEWGYQGWGRGRGRDLEQRECDQEVLRVVGRTMDVYEYRSLVAPRIKGRRSGGVERIFEYSHLIQREGGQDEFRGVKTLWLQLEQRGGGWEINLHVCLLFQT